METVARISIRLALPEDEEGASHVAALATADLRRIYQPVDVPAERKRPLRDIKHLVALIENQVVGTARYYREADRLHILGLGTRPTFRRRGIARALVQAIEAAARDLGICRLSLYTVKETGNVPIFRKLGFEVVSEYQDELSKSDKYQHLTEVYMERMLL